MIYFDNAATSYPKPQEVYEAVNYAMREYSFNAGRGSYEAANRTFKMIDETREKISKLANCMKQSVVFTSSATESLNNILYGLKLKNDDYVYISPFEHNAIVRTLFNIGITPIIIPFDKKTWELDTDAFESLLILYKPKSVIISQISNVTGYELPYEKIFKMSKKYNSINILDSAQAFGVNQLNSSNVDFMVFAGHKSLHAMFGIAGYINYNIIDLAIYKVGGTGSDSLNLEMPESMPIRYEAGSMNSIGIYSINIAIDLLKKAKFDIIEEDLTKYFLKKIVNLKNIIIYVPDNYIPKGIISFNVVGYTADEVGNILSDDYDICVRTGYHCAPLIHEFIDSMNYNGTVRISFNGFNKKEEIDVLISALKEM